MKRIVSLAIILVMALGVLCSCGGNKEPMPYGHDNLTGCWVLTDSNKMLIAIEFLPNGVCYRSEQRSSDGNIYWSSPSMSTYYTTADGLIILSGEISEYKLKGSTLTIFDGDEEENKFVFKKWKNNIANIEDYKK